MKPKTGKESKQVKDYMKIYESENTMNSPASDTLRTPRRYTTCAMCIGLDWIGLGWRRTSTCSSPK